MDNRNYPHNSVTIGRNKMQTSCLQINFQHSRSATYNLMKIIETEEPNLLLIQEPYEYQNKPPGMEKKNRIYTEGTGNHRAAIIVINSKIEAILIAQLSDEDTIVLEIVHRKQKCFAASMYFDHEEQTENKF